MQINQLAAGSVVSDTFEESSRTFAVGDGWNQISGNYAIADGVLDNTGVSGAQIASYEAVGAFNTNGRSFSVSVNAQSNAQDRWLGIVLNFQDASSGGDYYLLRFKANNTNVQLIRYENGMVNNVILNTNADQNFSVGEAFRIQIASLAPGLFDCLIADQAGATMFDGTLQDPSPSPLENGVTGLFTAVAAASEASFDDFHITQIAAINPQRPRIQLTPDLLDEVKDSITALEEPRYSAWLNLKHRADAWINETASPYTGDDSLAFYNAARGDGSQASKLALAYLVTGDTNYAETAKTMLVAWARAAPTPATDFDPAIRTPSRGMDAVRGIMGLVWTYDWIYNYENFTIQEKADVEDWFRQVAVTIEEDGIQNWDSNNYWWEQYYQNHLTAHTMGVGLIGYAIGDMSLVQFAVDHPYNPRDFVELYNGMIMMAGDPVVDARDSQVPPPFSGEITDRYRHEAQLTGLYYAHLSLKQLLAFAETLYLNGVDFYSYHGLLGENLEYPFDYYADFSKLQVFPINGDYYLGEPLPGDSTAAVFEVANMRYPGNSQIEALLRSVDRTMTDEGGYYENYFCYPTLTHGAVFQSASVSLAEFNGQDDSWDGRNLSNVSIGPDSLEADAASGDPQLRLLDVASLYSLECADYREVHVRVRISDASVSGNVQLFWGTSDADHFSSQRQVSVPIVQNGEFNVYVFDLVGEPDWSGILDDIRVDPFQGSSNIGKRFTIDWIRLTP